ncbi:hypothetical protein [Spirosoma sp. KNUC1025]|uniref:hypothetical protein n=1 Tax=Spirosoma sp. KNUC1025 TaxID=2894082 RepID=UPI003866465B|nr:hypothetical protein LN737_27485 [Spirosoma sp. KNUC1025]
MIWLGALAFLAYYHFFQNLSAKPPHFLLAIGLPLLLIAGLAVTTKGRALTSTLPLSTLTLLHTVRVPVELTLYGLYVYQQIPQLMTFEGRNFDILAGLTAPVVSYFAFRQKRLSARGLLLWNILSLGLVLNIVVQAILSAPLPFQQLAFDQPNVGILKFPYIWLPGYIVPAVLFGHVIAIQRLLREITGHKSADKPKGNATYLYKSE